MLTPANMALGFYGVSPFDKGDEALAHNEIAGGEALAQIKE